MVQLDLNPDPKIPILLQTVDHTHRLDSAVFPFYNETFSRKHIHKNNVNSAKKETFIHTYNNLKFVQTHLDAYQKNIHSKQDHSLQVLQSVLISGLLEFFSV